MKKKIKYFILLLLLSIFTIPASISNAMGGSFVFKSEQGMPYFAAHHQTINGHSFQVVCMQHGGYLRDPDSMDPNSVDGYVEGDYTSEGCSYCGSPDQPWSGIKMTNIYNYSSQISYRNHQDVAYAFTIEKSLNGRQDIIWASSINEGGYQTGTSWTYQESQAYLQYYNQLQARGGYNPKNTTKKDASGNNDVDVLVNQDDNTYTVGPYEISYLDNYFKRADGTRVNFGEITSLKVLNYKTGKEENLVDILDEKGNSILARADYKFPANGEKFYVKIKAKTKDDAPDKIKVDVKFRYIKECTAMMYRFTGSIFEWSWIDYTGTHDHSWSHEVSDGEGGTETCYHDIERTSHQYYLEKEDKAAQTLLAIGYSEDGGEGSDAQQIIKTDELDMNPNGDDLTMNLGGTVFHDELSNKAGEVNGKIDQNDKFMKNIVVTLYEKGTNKLATLAQEDGEIRTNPTLTDENGYYEFKGLNALKKYYVVFTFNGQKYENTAYKVNISDYNTNEWSIRSKASILNVDRKAYNQKFEEINSYSDCYTDINNITGFGFETNSTYKIFEQTDAKGEQERKKIEALEEEIFAKIRDYISSHKEYPNDSALRKIYQNVAGNEEESKRMVQYLVDLQVTAKTGYKSSMQYYPVYDEFVIDKVEKKVGAKVYKPIYDGQYEIHLGLMDREKLDLTLQKDLEKIKVIVNNKEYVYEYDNRRSSYDIKTVELRGSDVSLYGDSKRNLYERDLRESDVSYIQHLNDTSGDYKKRLRIFLTYRIRIINDSPGAITGYVTELHDFYDQDYTFINGDGDEVTSRDEFKSKVVTYNETGIESTANISWDKDNTLIGDTYSLSTRDNNVGKIGLKSSEYFDVYNSFEVKTEAIQRLLNQREDTKENYAEIGAYKSYYTNARSYQIDGHAGDRINVAGYVAGLVDRDSKPGTLDVGSSEVKQFVEYSYTDAYKNLSGAEKTKRSKAVFEDDADKAPGLQLKILETMRTLEGNVWEDKTIVDTLKNKNIRIGDGINNDGQSINQLKVELIDMDMPTQKEQNTYPYQHTTYTTVTDIYDINNHQFKKAKTYTDNNGYYKFEGYIPGNYLVRYTYGDEFTLTTDANGKVINGQDYKSTLYNEGIHQYSGEENDDKKYWYQYNNESGNAVYINQSDAQDNLNLRNDINTQNETMTNHVANILNYTVSNASSGDGGKLAELQKRSNMYADTEKLQLEVEYIKTSSKYTEDVTAYAVKGIDFGIVERPRAELTLTKDVANIKVITAGDNQTIFDAEGQTANLGWLKPKNDANSYERDEKGRIQATVDENLLHGATVKILYKFIVENTGEKDYVNSDGTVNKSFYNTGAEEGQIATTNVNYMLDYIENNINFSTDMSLDADNKYNQNWQVISKSDIRAKEFVDDTVLSRIRENVTEVENNTNKDQYQYVIQTKETSPIRNKLKPAEKRGGTGEKTEETLLLTKVLNTNTESGDDWVYENGAEIVQTSNEEGRRHYNVRDKNKTGDSIAETTKSIPGNYDPISHKAKEPDENLGEQVVVLVPFGKENITIYIVGAIFIIAVLGVGIFIIKRKILDSK